MPIKQDNEEEDSKSGGKTGAIGYKFNTLADPQRDDLLSPAELRRLLSVLKDTHKERVDNQKRKRKERDDIKNGRTPQHVAKKGRYSFGAGGGGQSPYKKHPISDKFAGRDQQVAPTIDRYAGETNANDQEKLEQQHQLQHQHQHVPKFNPRPRPRG